MLALIISLQAQSQRVRSIQFDSLEILPGQMIVFGQPSGSDGLFLHLDYTNTSKAMISGTVNGDGYLRTWGNNLPGTMAKITKLFKAKQKYSGDIYQAKFKWENGLVYEITNLKKAINSSEIILVDMEKTTDHNNIILIN